VTLPPWRSSRKEDQEALTHFVIEELDREDEQSVRDAGTNAESVRHIELMTVAATALRRLNLPVPWLKGSARPGPRPREASAYDRAAADVPRIRAIFVRHWGKRNRTIRPMAEEIAAARWELSPEETAILIKRVRRKT
jgi:hypothetical protein